MAKAATRRRNTVEIIREDVLKLTQREVSDILGYLTHKSIYEMERADEDRINLDQIRLLKAYAVENGIRWPANLIGKLLENDPGAGTKIPKRARGRPVAK